jgi:hypothetical protein
MENRKAQAKAKETKKEDELFKTYQPSEDYQVLQAMRYLQGFKVFESSAKSNQ